MKPFLLYIITLLSFSFSLAQQKNIIVNWDSTNITSAETDPKRLLFSPNMGSVIDSKNTLYFSTSWKQQNTSFENSKISNIKYEPLKAAVAEKINSLNIPTEIKYNFSKSYARDILYINLNFTPIIRTNTGIKKIISFDLIASNNTIFNQSSKRISAAKILKTSSVLATGNWHKFKINKTGVYKITPQFLQSIGVNLSGVNANTIKIYGNGGLPLPLRNSENLIFDLPENPIKIIGAEDGVFSGNDHILFYGRGSIGFISENDSHINPYSDETFYYITTGGAESKRIETMTEPTGTANTIFNSYDFYTFYEKDLFNPGRLGRKWLGDLFDIETTKNYNFFIPEIIANTNVTCKIKVGATFSNRPNFNITYSSGTQQLETTSTLLNSYNPSLTAYSQNTIGANLTNFTGNRLNISTNLVKNGDPSTNAYMDYISISAECKLKGLDDQFTFSKKNNTTSLGITQFNIENTNNVNAIWNVTDPYNISEKVVSGSSTFVKINNTPLNTTSKFAVINKNKYYSPQAIENSKIANQDLKGQILKDSSGNDTDLDYLIITKPAYLSAANRLANFRKSQDGFNVKIITPNKIYEEFSSGKQDVGAIRNFIKYIYDNASSPNKRLKYICIIGDGSFDYKNRTQNNTNDVPLFHSINSTSFANGYSSDDFYGYMDTNEGTENSFNKLDIAIGRIVAPTLSQANIQVSKIINYYSKEAQGSWRNDFLFIADDVDKDFDSQLQVQIDTIANRYQKSLKNANLNKLYADAFKQEVSSGGERYPIVKENIVQKVELGQSYINYFGHGGEDGLSSERIFTIDIAKNFTNKDRPTVFTTLTCELTRFDNPTRTTAGEYFFWNPNGGAVALLTTTRNLFVTLGLALNNALGDALFGPNQSTVPIGEAIRIAKNNVNSTNKLVVFCIGDPALKIALPEPKIILTEINGIPKNNFIASNETLKALETVSLSGELQDNTNNLLNTFNGEVAIKIFDKNITRTTLSNDGTFSCITYNAGTRTIDRCTSPQTKAIYEFNESGSILYNGKATVKNGKFSTSFILPRNVKQPIGEGKISFYAENKNILLDKSGNESIQIGGLNTNATEDLEPPVIDLFLDNENFVNGQRVINASPNLIAKFSDVSGINTSGGAGHDIILIIDNDEKNPIILNEFYSTELDNFKKGILNYRIRNLAPGEHTLELRASDTYNNVSSSKISFKTIDGKDFSISEVLNYPNPFTSYTGFWFTHTSDKQDTLEVSVQVMTVSGKIVTTKFSTVSGQAKYRNAIEWDGRDDFGDKIGKGVYIYKITVKSTLTNKTAHKFEKLVIL